MVWSCSSCGSCFGEEEEESSSSVVKTKFFQGTRESSSPPSPCRAQAAGVSQVVVLSGQERREDDDDLRYYNSSSSVDGGSSAVNHPGKKSSAVTPLQVVDYHTSCTPLYKRIEQEDWDAVDFFLENHFWPGQFFAYSNSIVAEQCRTWVTHFDSGTCGSIQRGEKHTSTCLSILPLHLALYLKAPFSIIAGLIEHYPESVRCTDDMNFLPLYLAVRHDCSPEVVDYLFRVHPDAILEKCRGATDASIHEINLTALERKILEHDMVHKRLRILWPTMSTEERRVVTAVLDGKMLEAASRTLTRGGETEDEVLRTRSKVVVGVYDMTDVRASHNSTTGTNTSCMMACTSPRECSYELDCTPLFKHIENKEWEAVDKFLVSGYWPDSFSLFGDNLPPAGQVRTRVTRFDPDQPNHARWSMLPLHMAVILDAPFTTIGKLVEIYPEAVSSTDDQGFYPLHLAMLHGRSNQVLDFLFRAFPDALDKKVGKYKLSPLDCAMVGKDAVRARILNTLVKKSQYDATKAVASLVSEQISDLRTTIEQKQKEIKKHHPGGRYSTMSRAFREVTEKIKECERVAQQLQYSGGASPDIQQRLRQAGQQQQQQQQKLHQPHSRKRQQEKGSGKTSVFRQTKSAAKNALSSVLNNNKRSSQENNSNSNNSTSSSSSGILLTTTKSNNNNITTSTIVDVS